MKPRKPRKREKPRNLDEEVESVLAQVNALADKVKINVSVSIDKDGQFKSFDMSVDKFEEDGLAVNELKLSISGSNYNNVADITIPDEAANATDISSMLGSEK